jgi:HEAT repeat protein
MLRFLSGINLDRNSFWIGFLAGSLFLWLINRLRPLLPGMVDNLRARLSTARGSITVNPEERYRRDVLRRAQRAHLSSVYFSLDEVLVPPRLLAPPPAIEPGDELHESLIFNDVLPYLPDCPELGSYYHSLTLSLTEALSGGANLVLVGKPGMGKTVALAYLASALARQEVPTGPLAGMTPYLVYASDFLPIPPDQPPLEALIAVVAENVSALTLPRLPHFIRSTFDDGKALLLLDGLDELPPEAFDQLVDFIDRLLKAYPQARILAAASPEYIGGLTHLGFQIIPLAAWNDKDRLNFINKWSELWTSFIAREKDKKKVDPLLLNNWLAGCEPSFTPLELTLHVWAANAGDVLGAGSSQAIESYLLRMTASIQKARPVLERLATQIILTANPALTQHEAEKWIPADNGEVLPFQTTPVTLDEPDENLASKESVIDEEGGNQEPGLIDEPLIHSNENLSRSKDGNAKVSLKEASPSQRLLGELVTAGLLVNRKNSRLSFIHPVIAGYLAGAALASSGGFETLVRQPAWSGKSLALKYLSSWNDISGVVRSMVEESIDPLYRDLFTIADWLRDAPPKVTWRQFVLRQLSSLTQQEALPMSIRFRALVALAFSGDPGVHVLFRQNLEHPSDSVRELGALGAGLLLDPKAVKTLTPLLNDPVMEVRLSAVLALSRIGTKPAMEAIASTLLNSSEEMRRAAAEALAMQPEEGFPALEEGSSMADLLVRRAVVYGLARVKEPWARQRLDKLQIEDEQWVVRSAAIQVLEELERPNPRIPRPHPELAQTPWLIEFAGTLGLGIAPGKPALDLVTQAAKTGKNEQRLAAVQYLGQYGGDGALSAIYPMLYSANPEESDTAYQALWTLSASGLPLTEPQQFGVG